MSNRIEVRYLQAAITLADEMNFTRAADLLGVSQSTFSRYVAELEDALGLTLFDRDHKTVEITDSGRAFVEEARLSLLHIDRSIHSAKAASLGEEQPLSVGRSPYIDPILTEFLLSVRLNLYPRLKIQLKTNFSGELAHGVMRSELDLALITNPPETPLLTKLKIGEGPFHVVLPGGHRLVAKASLRLNDLADERWILFERHVHPPLYDAITALAKSKGIQISDLHHVMTADEAALLVSQDMGVAFLTKIGAMRISRDGVVNRPLAEPSLVLETYLVSRADNRSKLLSEFVRAFMKKLANFSQPSQLNLDISA